LLLSDEQCARRGRTRTDRQGQGLKNERKPIDVAVVSVNPAGPFENIHRQKMLFFQPLSEANDMNQFGMNQFIHHQPMTPQLNFNMTSESTHFSNPGGMPSVMSTFENAVASN